MALSRTEPALSRWERVRTPALTIGGLAAATLALHLRDPHDSRSWGLCPTSLLGLSCPGCGSLRAVNDLTNGDVAAAASSNLLLVVAMPFVVLGLGLWAVDRWRGVPPTVDLDRLKPLVPAAIVVMVAFTLARNFAFGAWLAP